MTGNQQLMLVSIFCCGSMILVNNWVEIVSNLSLGDSSSGFGSSFLIEWMFFLVWFMWIFELSIDGERCFMRSAARFVHVSNYLFLVAWREFWRTRINRVPLYQRDIPRFVIYASDLIADGIGDLGLLHGMLVRLNYHMPDVPDCSTSITVRPFFTIGRWVKWTLQCKHHCRFYLWRLRPLIGGGEGVIYNSCRY